MMSAPEFGCIALSALVVAELFLITWLLDRMATLRLQLEDRENVVGALQRHNATLNAHIDAMRGAR